MSQEKFDDALSDPTSKIKSTNDVLMKAFWLIIWKEKITPQKWYTSMNKFVNNPLNVPKQTSTARTEMRSNMRQQLVRPRLSWKLFNRAIKALGITKFEIVFRYSFNPDEDDNNMRELKLPVLSSKTSGVRNSGRKSKQPIKTDDDNGNTK